MAGFPNRDSAWRIWPSVAVLLIILTGALLGVIIIPVVQGRSVGIDAYTAICRSLGILPGSPARPQIVSRNPPTPVSQVVWTPGVLQILADAKPERGRAKVMEICAACHGERNRCEHDDGGPFPADLNNHGALLVRAQRKQLRGREQGKEVAARSPRMKSFGAPVRTASVGTSPQPLPGSRTRCRIPALR